MRDGAVLEVGDPDATVVQLEVGGRDAVVEGRHQADAERQAGQYGLAPLVSE